MAKTVSEGYYYIRPAYNAGELRHYTAFHDWSGYGANTCDAVLVDKRPDELSHIVKISYNSTKGWYNIITFYLDVDIDGVLTPKITSGAALGQGAEFEWFANGFAASADTDYAGYGWDIYDRGTTTVDGASCKIVSFVSQTTVLSGAPALDCTNGAKSLGKALTMAAYNPNSAYQKFVLVPAVPIDTSLPTPYGLNHGTFGNNLTVVRWAGKDNNGGTTTKMHWQCADSYTGKFQLRYWIYQRAKEGDAWKQTKYVDWYVPTTTRSGKVIYASTAVKETPDDGYQQCKLQFEVRCYTTNSNGVPVRGASATRSTTYAVEPTFDVSLITWCPSGLRIQASSNFEDGATYVKNLRITQAWKSGSSSGTYGIIDTAKNYVTATSYDGTFDFIVPWERISDIGSYYAVPTHKMTLKYELATSSLPNWHEDRTTEVMPTQLTGNKQYDADGVAYTYAETGTSTGSVGEDALVEITWPSAASSGIKWMCRKTVDSTLKGSWANTRLDMVAGSATNKSRAMFTSDTRYYALMCYKDTTAKTWSLLRAPYTVSFNAHRFYWYDTSGNLKSFIVWLNLNSALEEKRSFSTQSSKLTLNGYARPVVSYLTAEQGTNYLEVDSTVSGVISSKLEDYGTTKERLEQLCEQGHCYYCSPSGRIASVAVTDADIEITKDYFEVSISLTEEPDGTYEV